MPKYSYYVVSVGRTTGVFASWNEAQAQVDGFSGNCYKGFRTLPEAEDWLRQRRRDDQNNSLQPAMNDALTPPMNPPPSQAQEALLAPTVQDGVVVHSAPPASLPPSQGRMAYMETRIHDLEERVQDMEERVQDMEGATPLGLYGRLEELEMNVRDLYAKFHDLDSYLRM
jgi:Caulimovirus viroplasmin